MTESNLRDLGHTCTARGSTGTAANVLLSGVVGSRAYGLDHAGSDIDRLGVFAETTVRMLGLARPRMTQVVKQAEGDQTMHEALKFCQLALKSNPTVMELLWLDDSFYEVRTAHGAQLIAIREKFLCTKYVQDAYFGYAKQQLLRLKKRGDGTSVPDVTGRTAKHARHMYRLLQQGHRLLTEGRLVVRLDDPGEVWDFGERVAAGDIEYASDVFDRFLFLAYRRGSVLPLEPDAVAVESWLIDVRREYGGWK